MVEELTLGWVTAGIFSVMIALLIAFMIEEIVVGRIRLKRVQHEQDLTFLISREDQASLSKADFKKTMKMSVSERKAFFAERLPNSVPQ